jgi:hypothetical protein
LLGERLGERHLNLAARFQGLEQAVRLFLVRRLESEREALEVWLALAVAVGCHDPAIADAEAGMQHLVFGAFRHLHAVRAVLEAHQGFHLGAERALVKLDRFLAAAVELQIGLNLHLCPPCVGNWR